GKEKWPRQKLLELQSIACSYKSCVFGDLDVQGKFPERHGFRGGKAFPYLLRRQACLQPKYRLIHRQDPRCVDAGIQQLPYPGLQDRCARLNALLKSTGMVKSENRYATQFD